MRIDNEVAVTFVGSSAAAGSHLRRPGLGNVDAFGDVRVGDFVIVIVVVGILVPNSR